jgi:predicted negative regulator of RcsB-dependent stress response
LTEYMTEQEQIEQLKSWIKQYGSTVIAGVVMALIIVTGWHYWERYKSRKLYHASSVYDEMITLRAQNETSEAAVQANKLINLYPRTPYAPMAALMLARDAAATQSYPEAGKQLNWVIDHSSNDSLREIAKTRLARLDLAQKNPQDTLDVLAKVDDKNFNGLVDQIRGDAYLLMNDTAKAQAAYQLALQELPKEDAAQTPLLQMKLDNLTSASNVTP